MVVDVLGLVVGALLGTFVLTAVMETRARGSDHARLARCGAVCTVAS